jgi:hypothetical protein
MGLSAECRKCVNARKKELYHAVLRLDPEWQYKRLKQLKRRTRDIPFLLTYEEFMELWQKPCHYCGTPVDSICIDRKDNDLDYTKENSVQSCVPCNMFKGKTLDTDFIRHCSRIADYQAMQGSLQ